MNRHSRARGVQDWTGLAIACAVSAMAISAVVAVILSWGKP